MYHSNLLIAVLSALSLPTTGFAAALPAPETTNATVLEIRSGEPILTLGYADCQTTTFFGGQLVTGERQDLFAVAGNVNVGCGDHENAPLGVGTHFQDMSWFQQPVCGMTLNFAPNGQNFDIYQDGHYDLLGTCYPHNSNTVFCADFLNGGTCGVETRFWCQWSGINPRPCA